MVFSGAFLWASLVVWLSGVFGFSGVLWLDLSDVRWSDGVFGFSGVLLLACLVCLLVW